MFVESPSPGPATLAPEPSLKGFIAWLERQPADKEYNFLDWGSCALCQYLISATGQWTVDQYYEIFPWPATLGPNFIAGRPWTFGAALARAKGLRS